MKFDFYLLADSLGLVLLLLVVIIGSAANLRLKRRLRAANRERALYELKIIQIRLQLTPNMLSDTVESVTALLIEKKINKANDRLSVFAGQIRRAMG